MHRPPVYALAFSLLALPLLAQEPEPQGEPLPRYLTPAERAQLERHPLKLPDAVTPPPTGPIHCVAEYEPMSALVVSWDGSAGWNNILALMAAQVTTIGNADYWVSVDNAAEQTTVTTALTNAGAVMSRVHFVIVPTDSIWLRDYGPRYIYQGNCRAVIDHTYNRPRPLDDAFNAAWAPIRGHALYELGLVHGGGNYHLDALNRSRCTRLIDNENPSLTEQQIHDIWQSYQNVDTHFYDPFPTSVDATQHIDMWMQVIADDAVVISTWPANVGSIQAQICDSTAASMAAEGYTVYRVPARSVGGVHYTYTNVVMCNDLVLVPTYTNATVSPHNSEALAVWQAALPQKTIVQIPCQPIVSAAGVMHCIVQHVPAHLGGLNPTAYLVNLNGGEVLTPGNNVNVQWISDDDEAVQSVDLLLSTDGGASFPTVIASGLPRLGSFNWTVPDVCSGIARVRVVAHDAQSRTGSDDSDGNFAIAGTGCSALSANYGSGTPGQNGVPTLTATTPVLGQTFDITLGNAFPGATAVLLVGAVPAATPIAGATLLVTPILPVNLLVPGSGSIVLNLTAPSDTVFAGISLYWQTWVAVDPGSPSGLATTAGLQTRFGF